MRSPLTFTLKFGLPPTTYHLAPLRVVLLGPIVLTAMWPVKPE